ncbi:hypothetical protein SAMN02745221_01982 [Thermosyntropha lipolytica DSM 11003]|uniref:CobQ/CobB/MinD/ParA nucleotide binding domain-containing protein n=1 Tax=Thermosyntropha lipolytica DSM 11003 TaxID=1123382 RepID=A0A1M5RBA1_9FIRM|nr:hypothetical protein [Thermosyntropha lipolytica]SHH23093.1 hypothetical protein SAMN02745221_01982 [Thermosyntropha lipolytica DSM 11003]
MLVVNQAERVVEAFIGEYASGKSEIAINRAVELKRQGRKVTLVDLDTVEPFYTLRPIKRKLEDMGLEVISQTREDAFGLGETGAMLNPRARWALFNEGDIILDVGYGVYGARTLNLVEGAYESPHLRIIAVINYTRPMTGSLSRIKEYIKELGRVDAVVANTHLGDETTPLLIKEGNKVIIKAAHELGLPVDYMAVDKRFADRDDFKDLGVKVKFIERYMPSAMW